MATDLLVATCGADDLGGMNAVVMVAPEALLFRWRGYADPAPRVRPPPRFDSARGPLAANAWALRFANLASHAAARCEAERGRPVSALCRAQVAGMLMLALR